MPQFTDGKRIIFASEKAYRLFYEEKGFKPIQEKKDDNDIPLKEESVDIENSDVEHEEVNIDLNSEDGIPIAAKVSMLSYEDLKLKAKELGIPKYNTTKREDLIDLIVDALEDE